MKPQDSLRESADVFDERFKIYGPAYKRFGPVMTALFPNGVRALNAHDMNRLGIVVQIVSKMTRYAGTFEAGGHDDSLLDLSTYAAMLRELDAEGRARFEAPFPFELKSGETELDWGFKSGSVARGIGELMDRGDEIAREDPEKWGGKVPCASFPVGPTDAQSRADAIFSDPARKATLDGFKVGPIEPEAEPVVPRREPSYFRADAERRWAVENGEPLVIPEKPYHHVWPRVEEGPFDGVEQ